MKNARSFNLVRGDDRRDRTVQKRREEALVGSDQVERIGVDHEGAACRERRAESLLCAFARAEARSDDGSREFFKVDGFGREHEFGLNGVDGRGIVGQKLDCDRARAELEARTGGKERRADMTVCSAHDGEVAEGSLVGEVAAGVQNVREVRGFNDAEARERNGNVELRHDDGAGGVGAFVHEEPRLVGEKGDGGVGPDARDGADPEARFTIEARGDVKRNLVGHAFIEPLHGIHVVARDRALEAGAEEAVDDDLGFHRSVGVFERLKPEVAPFLQHGAGEFRFGVAPGKNQLDRKAALSEFKRADDGVAAVVAGARQDDGVASGNMFGNPFGRKGAGTAHQCVKTHAVGAARFELAGFFEIENSKTHGFEKERENDVAGHILRRCANAGRFPTSLLAVLFPIPDFFFSGAQIAPLSASEAARSLCCPCGRSPGGKNSFRIDSFRRQVREACPR